MTRFSVRNPLFVEAAKLQGLGLMVAAALGGLLEGVEIADAAEEDVVIEGRVPVEIGGGRLGGL